MNIVYGRRLYSHDASASKRVPSPGSRGTLVHVPGPNAFLRFKLVVGEGPCALRCLSAGQKPTYVGGRVFFSHSGAVRRCWSSSISVFRTWLLFSDFIMFTCLLTLLVNGEKQGSRGIQPSFCFPFEFNCDPWRRECCAGESKMM